VIVRGARFGVSDAVSEKYVNKSVLQIKNALNLDVSIKAFINFFSGFQVTGQTI